jgi:hypothetical protein
MSNRAQAWGMLALAVVMLAALALNIQLRNAGEPFHPLHILLLGPLALYCAMVGWRKWNED